MDFTAYPGLVAATLAAGVPALVLQLAVTGGLLVAGVALYKAITPYDEEAEIAAGNAAAGIVLGGSVVSLAIPLAATLASHGYWLDILVWGIVALVLQLGVFAVLFSRKRVREGIAQRNVARAVATVGAQLAFAAVNAGAMLG